MKPIRYTTLVKRCGLPRTADRMKPERYFKAIQENRVLTIHHGESHRERDWAEVGHHIVNVMGRVVFPKPLPVPYETMVHGIHHLYEPSRDKLMKEIILRTHCPTNDYWPVDFIHVQLAPDDLQRLVTLRDRTKEFFKTIEPKCSWGHISYDSPVRFNVHADGSDHDLVNELLERAEENGVKWIEPPVFDRDCQARTELHSVMIFMDGDVWLRALSKDGGDYVEAEFPLDELLNLNPKPSGLVSCMDQLDRDYLKREMRLDNPAHFTGQS